MNIKSLCLATIYGRKWAKMNKKDVGESCRQSMLRIKATVGAAYAELDRLEAEPPPKKKNQRKPYVHSDRYRKAIGKNKSGDTLCGGLY